MVDNHALVKPLPIVSISSRQLARNLNRRLSISTSSTSAVTVMPTGVAAVCVMSTTVPTER